MDLGKCQSLSVIKELSCARAVATAGHPLGPGKDCGSREPGLGPLKSRHVEAGFHMFPHAPDLQSAHGPARPGTICAVAQQQG